MDFVTDLPTTPRGHNTICTFVDRFSKQIHLAPTTKQITAEGTARLYLSTVFAHHGLSRSIVSDRDPRFRSGFWEAVLRSLGTQLKMSTANHPQTDGQTEIAQRAAEDVLRSFVNYRQEDWDDLLPLVEFALNDKQHSSTGFTPFYLSTGRNPLSPADLINPAATAPDPPDPATTATAASDADNPADTPTTGTAAPNTAATAWLNRHQEALRTARDSIIAAQARQARYADRHREPVNYKAGDQVLVSDDFICPAEERDRPSRKLRPKWHGPFPITARISSNAFRIQLPKDCRAHPVITISALRPYTANDFPDRTQPPPPPTTDLNGQARFEVEEVLKHGGVGRGTMYLVRWKGYTETNWEPAHNLKDEDGNDIEALQRYKARRNTKS
jgi:hypothetical protein